VLYVSDVYQIASQSRPSISRPVLLFFLDAPCIAWPDRCRNLVGLSWSALTAPPLSGRFLVLWWGRLFFTRERHPCDNCVHLPQRRFQVPRLSGQPRIDCYAVPKGRVCLRDLNASAEVHLLAALSAEPNSLLDRRLKLLPPLRAAEPKLHSTVLDGDATDSREPTGIDAATRLSKLRLLIAPPGIGRSKRGEFALDAKEFTPEAIMFVQPVGVDQPRRVVGRHVLDRRQEYGLVAHECSAAERFSQQPGHAGSAL